MNQQATPAGCPEPVSLITAELLKQGLLGLAIVILILVIIFLFKRSERLAGEHKTALETKDKENAAEITKLSEQKEALVQRHVGKAETWIEKSQELSARLNSFLETIAREVRERGSEKNPALEALLREMKDMRDALLRQINDTMIREKDAIIREIRNRR
jgi:DNA anti-recombination protein RmuC